MEGVKLSGMYMVSITGCDNCPMYLSKKKICRLIRLDTDKTQTVEIGQGRIKVGCPFHSSDLIGIHLNKDRSIMSYIQKNMN